MFRGLTLSWKPWKPWETWESQGIKFCPKMVRELSEHFILNFKVGEMLGNFEIFQSAIVNGCIHWLQMNMNNSQGKTV